MIRLLRVLEQGDPIGQCRLFSRVCIGKGSSIGRHKHERESEIFYILRGRGVAEHNGEIVVLNEGDVMMIGDGMFHAIRNDEVEELEFLAIIIADA